MEKNTDNSEIRSFVALNALTSLIVQLVRQGVLDKDGYLNEVRTGVVSAEMRGQTMHAGALRSFIDRIADGT